MARKPKENQDEQSRRFTEAAREHECDADPETFERAIHKVASAKSPAKEGKSEMTWYVAYSPLPTVAGARIGQKGEHLDRFLDEADAKKYAKQIATDPKIRIRAGTLPGIEPAVQIEPTKLQKWLGKGGAR